MEFIRLEIYEEVNCGIVLCGTNVFRDEVEKGKQKGILEQTKRRGMVPLQLPSMLPRADMDTIAAAYGLPSAPDFIHQIRTEMIRKLGLRSYTNHLRAAGKLAYNNHQEFSWDHFVKAHDIMAKYLVQEPA
jgi:DNA transposition AAA+ family ATPase